MNEHEAIVTVEVPLQKKRLFGMFAGQPYIPAVKPGTHLYSATQQPDGRCQLRRIMDGGSPNTAESLGGDKFYYVGTDKYCFSPTFSKVVTDKQGHEWDCRIAGKLSVSDSQSFLDSFAVNIAAPDSPVTPILAESWIANRISPNVHDAVRSYSIADLRDRQALPSSWWEKRLAGWLNEFGVTIQVDTVSWSSAQAEVAAAEAARQIDLERVAAARQKEQEADLRETAARAEYKKQKKQIESDLNLSDLERSHQLQMLEKQHRRELIEADTQLKNARRAAEKAALAHKIALARLRQDQDGIKQAEERDQQAEDHHRVVMEEINELKETLTKLADLPGNLLEKLASQDAQKANATAERLVSPEFGILASSLAGLGFQVNRQSLVEVLRERAAINGDKVSIHKADLRCRDIGKARVKGLPINTSLQFKFSTERSGYVTMLNIGTSGSVYIHVPSPYVPQEQARVNGTHTYCIPGPELLPWERLRQLGFDYVEVGPPGWEHIAVLVTDKPLVNVRILERADAEAPFVKLTNEELSGFGNMLLNMPPDMWSAGILSFLVE